MAAPSSAFKTEKAYTNNNGTITQHSIAITDNDEATLKTRFHLDKLMPVQTDSGSGFIGLCFNHPDNGFNIDRHNTGRVGAIRCFINDIDYLAYTDAGLNTLGNTEVIESGSYYSMNGFRMHATFTSGWYVPTSNYGYEWEVWDVPVNQGGTKLLTGSTMLNTTIAAATVVTHNPYTISTPVGMTEGRYARVRSLIVNDEGTYRYVHYSNYVAFTRTVGYSSSYLDDTSGAGSLTPNTAIWLYKSINLDTVQIGENIYSTEDGSTFAPNGTYVTNDTWHHLVNGIVTEKGSVFGPEVTNDITVTRSIISSEFGTTIYRFNFNASLNFNVDNHFGGDIITWEWSDLDQQYMTTLSTIENFQIQQGTNSNYFDVSQATDAPNPFLDGVGMVDYTYYQGMTYNVINNATEF